MRAKPFETVLWLGCNAAKGVTPASATDVNVANAIFKYFSGCKVSRVDGTPLVYWLHNASTCTDTAGLLKADDGQCGSFADLFLDCLKPQGLTGAQKIMVTSSYGGNSSFLVKSWTFAGAGTSGVAAFPSFLSTEVTDNVGVAGQNNPNPPGAFLNHFIVLFDGAYYDPSYGHLPFTGVNDAAAHAAWEDASIDGFTQDYTDGAGHVVTLAEKNDPGVANIETVFTPVPE